MEDTLVEVRSSAARVIADRKELERNMARLQDAQDDWYAKAELALNKGREDLASAALMERAKLAEMAEDLESNRVPLDEALKKYESDIISLEAKIKEAKLKQRSLVERQESATSQLKVRQKLYDNRIGDVMVRFTQMENVLMIRKAGLRPLILAVRKLWMMNSLILCHSSRWPVIWRP